MTPVGRKKSGCKLENEPGQSAHPEDGLTERSDISRDPAMERKILLKTEALRERLKLWASRMDELVSLINLLMYRTFNFWSAAV